MRKIFKYGNILRIVVAISLTIIAMTIYASIRAVETFRSGDEIYFLIGIPLITVFITFPLLAYRHVVITEKGLARAFFGLQTGIVRWERIVSVRCGVISAHDKSVTSYHLRTKAGSPFGGVSIMTMIDDVDVLVEAIANEVRRRKIPIFAWEVNTLVRLEELPPPTKGPAAWR